MALDGEVPVDVWQTHGLSPGIVRELDVADPDGLRYTLFVWRQGLPEYFSGPLAPIEVPLRLAVFAIHRLRQRGYQVKIGRAVKPGRWRSQRPLPYLKTITGGPFASAGQAMDEGDAIASLISQGKYHP